MQKAGQWLLGIINDILAFAKIESGKLELVHAEFDLHQLVADVLALHEVRGEQRLLEGVGAPTAIGES